MRPAQREGYDTLYHLTDRRKFALDPTKVPADNAISIRGRSQPGLYAASDIEPWWNGHGYHRPYVAEIQVPHGVAQDERWSGEKFIPGEQLGQATVSRVIPTDAWVRENYHAPGWLEEHAGKAFDTGEPVDHRTQYPDYHYDGPDVRDFTPEQHKTHMQGLRSYRRSQGT